MQQFMMHSGLSRDKSNVKALRGLTLPVWLNSEPDWALVRCHEPAVVNIALCVGQIDFIRKQQRQKMILKPHSTSQPSVKSYSVAIFLISTHSTTGRLLTFAKDPLIHLPQIKFQSDWDWPLQLFVGLYSEISYWHVWQVCFFKENSPLPKQKQSDIYCFCCRKLNNVLTFWTLSTSQLGRWQSTGECLTTRNITTAVINPSQ